MKVTMNTETPPILMFGPSGDSTGAYFAGNVAVNVQKPTLITQMEIYFIQVTKYSSPFISQSSLQNCLQCQTHIEEIASWDLLPAKKLLDNTKEFYSYPISTLLSGDLPPSTHLTKGSYIKYELVCVVRYEGGGLINLSMPIIIQRSILRSHDRNSLRIFPPTDVTASAVIPNVVYPRSTFPIEIRMDHVVSKDRRWRMRKLNWRLEESCIVRLNHCDDHLQKFDAAQREMKRLQRNRKIHKSSGGLGHNTLNFYFEVPQKVLKARELAEQARQAAEQERERIQQGIDPVPVPTEQADMNLTNIQSPTISTNQIGSVASGTMTNNPSISQSLQDEVVMPQLKTELYVEELKTLATGELKSGWKSDFSGDGRIEMNVEVPLRDMVSTGFNNSMSLLSSISSSNCQSSLFNSQLYEQSNNDCNCSVDIDDDKLGIFVSHNLVLEVVVGEEVLNGTLYQPKGTSQTPKSEVTKHPLLPQPSISSTLSESNTSTSGNANGNSSSSAGGGTRLGLSSEDFPDVKVGPDQATGNKKSPMNNMQGVATGVARVLRMQFRLCVTERSGMGISWDMEVPPTYVAIADEPTPPPY